MTSEQLKQQLDSDLIVKILEELGCHHISIKSKYVSAGLYDGDNPSSVCVYIDNDDYYTKVFTRSEFEQKPFRDIITLVEFIKNISSQQAISFICRICGFNYYQPIFEKPNLLKWLDFVESGSKLTENENLVPLPENILHQFRITPVMRWEIEGLSYQSQTEFQIGVDVISERIIIPIRDELGNLVGVKGRLLDDNKIIDDKYIYIYSCPKSKILFGLHKNYQDIKSKNEVIVVEGEKNVIKLNSLGFKNVVATGSKNISKVQIDKLLRLNVAITLAFDKDVEESELMVIANELKSPLNLSDVYIITDPMGFMSDKESPCDNSDTWETLYNNFRNKV